MALETLLSGLSVSEKLEAMDILWRDLSQSADVPIPQWHGEVLAHRQQFPDPAPALPLEDAIKEVKERLHARRTATFRRLLSSR